MDVMIVQAEFAESPMFEGGNRGSQGTEPPREIFDIQK